MSQKQQQKAAARTGRRLSTHRAPEEKEKAGTRRARQRKHYLRRDMRAEG